MSAAFQIAGRGGAVVETDDAAVLARLRAGHIDAEIARLRRALIAAPERGKDWHFLSLAHSGRGAHDIERALLHRALCLAPNSAHLLTSLGMSRLLDNDAAGAHAAFDQALEFSPNFAVARYQRALIELEAGHFTRGWSDYEYRFAADTAPGVWRGFPSPVWDGHAPLDGKLLVWGEQTVSMEILFSSVLHEIDADNGLVVECDPLIKPLLERALPGSEIVARADPPDPRLSAPDIAANIPMGRICGMLRRNYAAFPQSAAHLTGEADRAMDLMLALATPGRRTIGLSWRRPGGKAGGMTLESLRPILETPDVTWISLEGPDALDEIERFAATTGIRVDASHGIDPAADLDGTAALALICDLVLTIDNPAAHLAGALGRTTWTMLPDRFRARWFWFSHHRTHPPVYNRWYRGMRLLWRRDDETEARYIRRLADLVLNAAQAA